MFRNAYRDTCQNESHNTIGNRVARASYLKKYKVANPTNYEHMSDEDFQSVTSLQGYPSFNEYCFRLIEAFWAIEGNRLRPQCRERTMKLIKSDSQVQGYCEKILVESQIDWSVLDGSPCEVFKRIVMEATPVTYYSYIVRCMLGLVKHPFETPCYDDCPELFTYEPEEIVEDLIKHWYHYAPAAYVRGLFQNLESTFSSYIEPNPDPLFSKFVPLHRYISTAENFDEYSHSALASTLFYRGLYCEYFIYMEQISRNVQGISYICMYNLHLRMIQDHSTDDGVIRRFFEVCPVPDFSFFREGEYTSSDSLARINNIAKLVKKAAEKLCMTSKELGYQLLERYLISIVRRERTSRDEGLYTLTVFKNIFGCDNPYQEKEYFKSIIFKRLSPLSKHIVKHGLVIESYIAVFGHSPHQLGYLSESKYPVVICSLFTPSSNVQE